MNDLIDQLRSEPALAYKLAVGILGCDPLTSGAHQLDHPPDPKAR